MNRLTIVADENIPAVQEYFSGLGDVVTVNGRQLTREQLLQADILLVRSVTAVDEQLLRGTPVRFVASATIGIDHLDTDYLAGQGIAWTSAPGSNADSVVEYIFSVFCAIDGVLERLFAGATVGIIGMGNVGGRLYQRLARLGFQCKGYDPLIAADAYPILSDLEDVLCADILCVHTPLTRSGDFPTEHLLNRQRLTQLRPGTLLINAGRGGVIDNQALLDVLQKGQDLVAVLDVWENEPAINTGLHAQVALGSPHIAGYSLDGKLAGTAIIYRACCQHLGLDPAKSDTSDKTYSEPSDLTAMSMALTEHGTLIDGVKEAVFTSYDVRRDSAQLAASLAGAKTDRQSEAFDQLRKNYPGRREFCNYRITNASRLDNSLVSTLIALGFSLSK